MIRRIYEKSILVTVVLLIGIALQQSFFSLTVGLL